MSAGDTSALTISDSSGGSGRMALAASQSWANNNATLGLTVSAAIYSGAASGSQTLTINGSGAGGVLLSGPISDNNGGTASLGMVFDQAGVTRLTSAMSSYTGTTTINGGTVNVAALGNVAKPSSIGSGSGLPNSAGSPATWS